MSFPDSVLAAPQPTRVNDVVLPRRAAYTASPADWRDQVLYFLLPDRFSDGEESRRPLVDAANSGAFRPRDWRWDAWAASGGERFQGGTLPGITSKLDYLQHLGITTLWIGPVFKQRLHWDSYHGYAIQDFLDVDPRFGHRRDLVHLVNAAHRRGMWVILDVIFNHTGNNWVYAGDVDRPPYRPWPGHYERGRWRDGHGSLVDAIAGQDDGVWPAELQREDYYTRAGDGSLGSGNIDDPHAEFRRTDFVGLRDVSFDGDAGQSALHDLARCLKYWIALTDCDGFRIDTLKHVDQQTGRNFCGTIKEFAAGLGKADFFLLGEVAGGDGDARRYREVLGLNLDATLDIGESRRLLHLVAKGRLPAAAYFSFVLQWEDELGSHREAGRRHVSILDDHDHVSGSKVRFSADADTDHQIVAGVAIQLFSLGIPCIYYGTEQALRGPEESEHRWLPEYNAGEPSTDRYLRETMFGAPHPRRSGRAGLQDGEAARDASLPGFGPFGTVGAHCFNPTSAAYVRIAALTEVRRRYPVLRYGRQYQRPVSNFGGPFVLPPAGELIAWSRILDDEEVLCIVNGNGLEARGGDVLVDASLNNPQAAGSPWGGEPPFFEVVASSAQAGAGAAYTGAHPIGEHLPVRLRDATAYVAVRNLAPSEVLVLSNRP